MSSSHNLGRVAGLWYLLLIAIGPLFLIYIPDKLYVKGNAAATVSNIAVSRLSWKWRKRSSVKIAERTYEKRAQALHC